MSRASSSSRARAVASRAVRARAYDSVPIAAVVTPTTSTTSSTSRMVMELWRAVTARRRSRSPLLVAAVILSVLPFAAPAVADGRRFGIDRDPSGIGLLLPGNLWVSGDVTLTLDVPEQAPTSGEIDDVSLLARWEPTSRLALFGELRVEDLLEVAEGEGFITGEEQFLVERLYAELLLTPRLSLRVGKIFTPFGLWNVISRAPLTWTVEEPAVVEEMFPRRATGVNLIYQTSWHGWTFDATTYGPAQDEITVHPPNRRGWLAGGRLAAGHALGPTFTTLGLNATGFRDDGARNWITAVGFDLELLVGGHDITGELTYREPTGRGRARHGLYLQDAFPLVGDLYGVLRFEYFQPQRGSAAVGQLVGLFWRPVPNVVVKADYLFGTRTLENFEPGFQASFSLLF